MGTVAKRSRAPDRPASESATCTGLAHAPSPACACPSVQDQRPCAQAEAAHTIGHEVSSWMWIWWRWNLKVAGGH